MRSASAWQIIGAIVAGALAASPSTAGGPPLRQLIDEYRAACESEAGRLTHQTASPESRREEYRRWLERFETVLRADPGASRADVRVAKGIQHELANGLKDWELSMRLADELVQIAFSPGDALVQQYNGAVAAHMLYLETRTPAHGEMALKRARDTRSAMERTPEALNEAWFAYIGVLTIEAQMRADLLGEHAQAAALYLKAEESMRTRAGKNQAMFGPTWTEDTLNSTMLELVKAGQIAKAEEVLARLATLPGRRQSLGMHVLAFAEAEAPDRGPNYQQRLARWLDGTSPSDKAWAFVAVELASAQWAAGNTDAAALTLQRILRAYEKEPPPDGVNPLIYQPFCYYKLALYYADRNPAVACDYAKRFLALPRPASSRRDHMGEEMTKLLEVLDRNSARQSGD